MGYYDDNFLLAIFIVGSMLCLLFFLLRKTGIMKKTQYVEVEATVISVAERKTSPKGTRDGKVYLPTFQYEWKGFTRTVDDKVWASFHNFNVGDKVILLIDPEDGSNFRYKNSFLDPSSFIIIMIVFVVALMVISLFKRF